MSTLIEAVVRAFEGLAGLAEMADLDWRACA